MLRQPDFRHYKVDDIAKVGLPLIDIELEGEGDKAEEEEKGPEKIEKKQSSSQSGQVAHKMSETGKVLATPAVRRIAMENKVEKRV